MKKIIIITPGFLPLLGGMEEQVYLLGKELIGLGNSVTVLTERTKSTFLSREIIEGINVERVNILPYRFCSFPSIFYSYTKHLLKNRYDLIIVRTFTFPAIVTGVLRRLKLINGKTVVTAETGGELDDIESISKRLFSKLIYYLIKGNDFFNCICEENYRHLTKHGFPQKRITRIYNGIDFEGYQSREYPNRICNFLFLGQLNKEKGIWELIHAMEELSFKNTKTKLFIGGDGPEKESIKKYIELKKLKETIIYQDRINREEKSKFFSQGECLVLPSYSEGFPLVIIEAAKYKKIILVTDVSDIKKIYGNRAFYCEKRDVESVKKQMLMLTRREISPKLNYDDVRAICDIRSIANQFLALIS